MADQEQFVKAFLNSEMNLRAFLGSLIRNRQDCQDVFQDTALTLWQKFGEYDPQRPFGAWARGIAAKKALQYRAKSGKTPTAFSPQTINAIIEAVERIELRQPLWTTALDTLEKCTELLPEHSRKILTMRYSEEWPVLQIAKQLNSTPTAVSMALSRIRAWLRKCVEQQLGRTKEQAK